MAEVHLISKNWQALYRVSLFFILFTNTSPLK